MERVIVAVRKTGENRVRDFELPAEVPISDLTELIIEALQWDKLPVGETYSIKVLPQGKVLSKRQTLLSAEVRSGSLMEFTAAAQAQTLESKPPDNWSINAPTSGGVVSGWISLTSDLPSGPPDALQHPDNSLTPEKPADQGGFTWKKIS